MIGEFFAEIFGDVLKEFVLIPLFYLAGKPVVWLLTLGAVHTTLEEVPAVKRKKKKPLPPQGITFVHNGRRYLDYRITCLAGIVVWGLVIFGIVVAVRSPA